MTELYIYIYIYIIEKGKPNNRNFIICYDNTDFINFKFLTQLFHLPSTLFKINVRNNKTYFYRRDTKST